MGVALVKVLVSVFDGGSPLLSFMPFVERNAKCVHLLNLDIFCGHVPEYLMNLSFCTIKVGKTHLLSRVSSTSEIEMSSIFNPLAQVEHSKSWNVLKIILKTF
jgi:hypothetical protein